MDNVPQKRPEQPDASNHASPSPSSPLTLPNRSRVDNRNHRVVTSNGRREVSASAAVNASSASTEDDDEDDYTSSSGSSLSSSDDEDDDAQSETGGDINKDNEEITSLPARRKPDIRRIEQESSLLNRLSAFLPQMKSANEDLEREIAAGRAKDIRLDDVDEGSDGQRDGQYIEMNLGLGVLEEKRPGDQDERDVSESHGQSEDTDLLDRLLGKEKTSPSAKPSIQDLGE
ncbi:hypothetical protein BDW60DRAFT_197147 [Aspergillus nidulans var. acristatus]